MSDTITKEKDSESIEFKNDDLGVSFSVPKVLTVEDQLEFYGVTGGVEASATFTSLWAGVLHLMSGWECKAFPKPNADLSTVTDPAITRIIIWAGSTLMRHVAQITVPPKETLPSP